MATEIRYAMIGCGRIAPFHGRALRDLPDVKLVAVADIVEERVYSFADEYNADPYLDYHEMLKRDDIDVVSVCTPSGMHAQIAIEVARAGKHVLVEKPIALSLADADAILAAAKASGVKLGVVFQNRYNPPIQDLHQAVNSRRLGKLQIGNITVRWHRKQNYYDDGWHGTWAMDGGVFMNQTIHYVDALLWLMDEPVSSVFSFSATLGHKMEAEDAIVVALRFKSGALATIEASTITFPTDVEGSLTLLGDRGSVKIGGAALNRKDMWKLDGELDHEAEILANNPPATTQIYGQSHPFVLADMANAIRDGREPFIDGNQGRRALEVVLAAYESVRTGAPVNLDSK